MAVECRHLLLLIHLHGSRVLNINSRVPSFPSPTIISGIVLARLVVVANNRERASDRETQLDAAEKELPPESLQVRRLDGRVIN